VELRIEASELVAPVVVAALDLDVAHRQRRCGCPDRPEALAPRFRLAQEVEVDVDCEDVLHAADVRMPELLVRVEEGAAALDAGGWIHDLVAVNFAATAFDLVLRSEWKLARRGRRLLACLHD